MKMSKEQWAEFVAKAAKSGIILDMQTVSEEREVEIRRMPRTGPLFVDYTKLM